MAWLTLAPKCKADGGPKPGQRSARSSTPLAASLPKGLLATRFGACPRLAEEGRPARRVAPGQVVSLLAGGFAQLCPAENDVPGPAPPRPELAPLGDDST